MLSQKKLLPMIPAAFTKGLLCLPTVIILVIILKVLHDYIFSFFLANDAFWFRFFKSSVSKPLYRFLARLLRVQSIKKRHQIFLLTFLSFSYHSNTRSVHFHASFHSALTLK